MDKTMNITALDTLKRQVTKLQKCKEEGQIDLLEFKHCIIDIEVLDAKLDAKISDLLDAIRVIESAYA